MTPADSGQPLGDAGVAVEDSPPADASEQQRQIAQAGAPELIADSVGEYARIWFLRLRGGESGALPVVLGLIAIVIFFQVENSKFLSPTNLVNLIVLAAAIILLGMAEVFVLLLGEIDLSVGFNGIIGGVITLWAAYTLPWWIAVLLGLAASAFIGFVQGIITTGLGLPSFVVTLAGLLGLNGLLIILVQHTGHGAGGSISNPSNIIFDLTAGSLSPLAGWIVLVVLVVLAGVFMILKDRRRLASGLVAPPLGVTLLKIGVMAAAGIVVVLIGNANRGLGLVTLKGVPWVVPVVLGVLLLYTVLTSRTRFGRYLYAIGGNAEAARRAGVNLMRVRTLAFTLCGLTAAMGGIMLASQLDSLGSDLNGGQYVLFAVAAAVIGGTNLFGGRGKMIHALLGGLVVATIDSGLSIIGLSAAATDIVTAIVLLAAVTIDKLARRNRPAS
ncbi:MAG TPA: ABC transporter permease [Streptosporangiaceae bacterium]